MPGDASRKNGLKGGRPKGSLSKATIDKMELDKQFRQRIAEQLEPLADALLRAAKGVEHLQAKDKRGQWTSVEDPKVMAKVLNGPEEYRRISAKDPDVRALKECFDRLFGQPKQHVEVEDVTKPSEMTDAELIAKAKQLLELA